MAAEREIERIEAPRKKLIEMVMEGVAPSVVKRVRPRQGDVYALQRVGIAMSKLAKKFLGLLALELEAGPGGSARTTGMELRLELLDILTSFRMARVRMMGPKRGLRRLLPTTASSGTFPARGPGGARRAPCTTIGVRWRVKSRTKR